MRRVKVVIYKARDGLFYWRLIAGNGKIVADGAEGYSTKGNARRAFKKAADLMIQIIAAESMKNIRKTP